MENEEKLSIMVIDDQMVILNKIVLILKDFYQVRPFTSGMKALAYIEKQLPDLILLDYDMPDMTGIEVLEKLQSNEKTKGIPVIFFSGSIHSETEVEVLKKGATDYIIKPIKAEVLLTRIRIHLELSHYRKYLEDLVAEKTEDLRKVNEKLKMREDITLNLLARTTDMKDHETGGHIKRTTEMVRILAMYLKDNPVRDYALTEYEVDDIVKSAKLHDLGKIAVPDKILLKPTKLEAEEFEIIKQHPLHGANMLDEYIKLMGDDSFLNVARDIALHHHEKWNGTGYPMGLKGEEIPLSARIVALADVYDALVSVRPYKKGLPHEKVVEIIKSESGIHFDPYLVLIFLEHEKEFENLVLTMK